MLQRAKKFILRHKFLSAAILIIIIAIGYFGYRSLTGTATQTSYVLGAVTRDTIITTVSGTGQVQAVNQLDIKPKVAGDVISVAVSDGQKVKAGDVLVKLDPQDAIQTLRDAQLSYDNAKLSLTKAQRGSRPEEIQTQQLQVDNAQKSLADARQNLETVSAKANFDLDNLYDDSKSILRDAYNNANNIISNQLDGIYSDNTDYAKLTFLTANSQAENDAGSQRVAARAALADFQKLIDSYPSDQPGIDSALLQAGNDLTAIQKFLSNLDGVLKAAIISNSLSSNTLNGYKSSLTSAQGGSNGSLDNISSQQRSLASQKITNQNNLTDAQTKISNAQDSLTQAQHSLDVMLAGTDPLDLQSQQLSVQQSANQLSSARDKLADYAITAPFDGIIANVAVKVGDPASAGTAVATLITPQQIAEISLNEVDAAKVKLGQKADLTFDAIDGLEITGKVIDIDTIGTVSQGVVSYNVKMSMDTPDDRIKPGMTVSTDIITDVHQNVLVVPSSAIKTSGSASYVEMLNQAASSTAANSQGAIVSAQAPRRQTVTTGLSDDTNTEITSGLNEGDQIITRTITAAVASTNGSQAPSILQSIGGNRSFSGGTSVRTGASAPRGD